MLKVNMVKTKKIILVKPFQGFPKETDYQVIEEELPALKDGEILCEALWFGVEAVSKFFVQVGKTVGGVQLAKIVESRNKDFPVGKHVVGYLGWQTLTVHDPKIPLMEGWCPTYIIPDLQGFPLSLGLGAVSATGNTAYFGFLEICKPQPREVVVITGAAGAVGSLVGQIARIKGCKVIGFTGSDVKVQWLKNELHFDAAYNYKKVDVDKALAEAAPNGVDCYFDNVGGPMSNTIMSHMNRWGRISVCGFTSSHNYEPPLTPMVQTYFPAKHLKMEGFMVFDWLDRWNEGLQQMIQWVKEKKIICRETVTEGFENLPRALIEMYQGENMGKALVKV